VRVHARAECANLATRGKQIFLIAVVIFAGLLLVLPLASLLQNPGDGTSPSRINPSETDTTSRFEDDFSAIYADDPSDPWNRIFRELFTRAIEVRLSDDFEEAAPFQQVDTGGFLKLALSRHLIERHEIGDRAIDPLYPSFLTSRGPLHVLNEP